MSTTYHNFMGAKLALFVGSKLAVLQRDDAPGLLWPGYWDLPGGGCENGETPIHTVLRETKEELSIHVPESQICWGRAYTNSIGRTVWFFVGRVSETTADQIKLGDEGQQWRLMGARAFISHPKAVPQFAMRLKDYQNGVQSQLFRKTPRLIKAGGR